MLTRLLTTVAALAALVALAACGGGGGGKGTDYPDAGEDRFEHTTATVQIELSQEGASAGPLLQSTETIELGGPALIMRGDPQEDDDGRFFVETEIVELDLSGTSALGPVTVRLSPEHQSLGEVRQQTPGEDYPADSFFDVWVEIDLPELGMTLHTEDPMHMEATLTSLPPAEGDSYRGEDDRPLYTPAGLRVGRIVDALHIPEPGPGPAATATEPGPTSTAGAPAPTDTPAAGGAPMLTITQTAGCEHTQPGVQSEFQKKLKVTDESGNPVEGVTVDEQAQGPGLLGPGGEVADTVTMSVVTDANGEAMLKFPIKSFGEYVATVQRLTLPDGRLAVFDPASTLTTMFTVGATCTPPGEPS